MILIGFSFFLNGFICKGLSRLEVRVQNNICFDLHRLQKVSLDSYDLSFLESLIS